MAILVDTSGDYLRRTANLPSPTSFTIAGWYKKRGTGEGTWEAIFTLASSGGSAWEVLYSRIAGGTNAFVHGASGQADLGITLATDTWYYIALGCDGTGSAGLTGWVITPSGTVYTASTWGVSFTPDELTLSTNVAWGEWVNGDFANVMVWNAKLTTAELQQQMFSGIPIVRRANLTLWSPLFHASDNRDLSGNGYNWTLGGALTAEDHPPVTYGMAARLIYAVSGGDADKTVSDAASGGEALVVDAVAPVSDVGGGADSVTVFIPIDVTDVAGGVDAGIAIEGSISLSDGGYGGDGIIIAAELAVSDTAAESELVDVADAGSDKSISDDGAGADTITIAAAFSVAESGYGTDATPSIAAGITAIDSGSGSDNTPTITVELTISDVGAGIDSAQVASDILKTVVDAAIASDAVSSVAVNANVFDAVTGVDAPQIAVMMTLVDTAAGDDLIDAILAALQVVEIATTAEIIGAADASIKIIKIAVTQMARQITFFIAKRQAGFSLAMRRTAFAMA